MESPGSAKPSTVVQRFQCPISPVIREIGITYLRYAVPLKHLIDSLRQLQAACLIDTASINPSILEAIGSGEFACHRDILIAASLHHLASCRITTLNLPPFAEADLLTAPDMVKYCIVRKWHAREVLELQALDVDEPHFSRINKTVLNNILRHRSEGPSSDKTLSFQVDSPPNAYAGKAEVGVIY